MDGNAYPRSPLSGSYLVPDRFLSGLGGAAVEEEEALALQLAHSEEELRDMEQDIQVQHKTAHTELKYSSYFGPYIYLSHSLTHCTPQQQN